MSTVNPFPSSDIDLVILIGHHRIDTAWPIIPRVGEIVHGYMLGSRMFSGKVLSVEHHFDNEKPEIHVRLHSRSILP